MNWYVVYTKPRQEARARENLSNQGFETFLPMIALEKLKQGVISRVVEPLFSRYIFVKLDKESSPWGSIRSTLGVSKLLTIGGEPAVVPLALIVALKSAQDLLKQQSAKDASYQRLLQPGEEVLFSNGPLKGMQGIFQKHDGDERAMVLIEIMSRPQHLSVEISNVVPVPA